MLWNLSKITFAEDAWEEYLYWQSEDKRTLKKINTLIKAIQREPFTGEGKPEPLKDNHEGEWSRIFLPTIVITRLTLFSQIRTFYNLAKARKYSIRSPLEDVGT